MLRVELGSDRGSAEVCQISHFIPCSGAGAFTRCDSSRRGTVVHNIFHLTICSGADAFFCCDSLPALKFRTLSHLCIFVFSFRVSSVVNCITSSAGMVGIVTLVTLVSGSNY